MMVLLLKRLTFSRFFSTVTMSSNSVTIEDRMVRLMKKIIPPLTSTKTKSQCGRIGIFGGSLEYTGAPYFAGMCALRIGVDLVHVFCAKDAAIPIKSYSPELMVHPILDSKDAMKSIKPWLDKLQVVLIGPGLGRSEETAKVITSLITELRHMRKPLVIDADGLYYISQKPDLVRDYPTLILTPNCVEYTHLVKAYLEKVVQTAPIPKTNEIKHLAGTIGKNVVILLKGPKDAIVDSHKGTETVMCTATGSNRRCGGQGDLVAGAVCVFLCWAQIAGSSETAVSPMMTAAYGASRLIRESSAATFKIKQRGMLTSDILEHIAPTFARLYETTSEKSSVVSGRSRSADIQNKPIHEFRHHKDV